MCWGSEEEDQAENSSVPSSLVELMGKLQSWKLWAQIPLLTGSLLGHLTCVRVLQGSLGVSLSNSVAKDTGG